ncbi:S8 family serine peptidase [candidate division TA06 bacterium]|nr:S8 family serine peptidase [candidate division TA06 bacterium]
MVENLIGIVEIGSMDWDELQNVLLSETNKKFGISNIESRIRAEGKGALPNHEPRISNIEWNISKIRADEVWAKGFKGKGVVVGHIDTGVNYNHVDLKDHMWTNPNEIVGNGVDDDENGYVDDVYGYDFANRDGDPIDDHGHGTHTAGTIAGDGKAGRQTGVAPDAQIMALKITDAAGLASESDAWDAIQYALDNGADVLSLSLGWKHKWNPNRMKWREAFENALAAGVITVAAAGNEREWGSEDGQPAPDNIRTPGDVPPPWLHPDQTLIGGRSGVVTVGATNSSDDIASFSSFGPVTWKIWLPWTDYPYNPEMGLMDPDISAPGVCITSLGAFNNTGYAPCWNGTSMATPHVAGVMALLLSENPELNPSTLDYLIETSALDRGPQGKDNDYGAGRIDAYAALLADTLGNIPIVLALLPNPNPFRDGTKIDFEIPYPGHVTLKVYDITGRLVITLLDEKKGLGRFSEPWNGRDERGVRVPNGIYFAWIEAEPEGGKEIERATRKMVFLK